MFFPTNFGIPVFIANLIMWEIIETFGFIPPLIDQRAF